MSAVNSPVEEFRLFAARVSHRYFYGLNADHSDRDAGLSA